MACKISVNFWKSIHKFGHVIKKSSVKYCVLLWITLALVRSQSPAINYSTSKHTSYCTYRYRYIQGTLHKCCHIHSKFAFSNKQQDHLVLLRQLLRKYLLLSNSKGYYFSLLWNLRALYFWQITTWCCSDFLTELCDKVMPSYQHK